MDFEKKVIIDAPIGRVWELLLDPTVMASCVPGTESVEVISDTEYLASLKVKISFIAARFKVRTKILETRAPHYLKSEGTGEDAAVGSSLKQSSELTLSELSDSKTELAMKISVDVFGRLGSFGLSVMKTKADRMWEEFGQNFNARAIAGTEGETGVASQAPPVALDESASQNDGEGSGKQPGVMQPGNVDRSLRNGSRSDGQHVSHRRDSWWKRLFANGGSDGDGTAIVLRRLPTDIYAEIEKDGTFIRLVWPAQSTRECVEWIKEYLK